MTKCAGPPWPVSGSARSAETVRLGRLGGRLRSRRRGGRLEQRRQLGIFAGGMKLLFAGARDQGMVRQPVFGMEGLHLFQAIGAVDAATDADGPGFRPWHSQADDFQCRS